MYMCSNLRNLTQLLCKFNLVIGFTELKKNYSY